MGYPMTSPLDSVRDEKAYAYATELDKREPCTTVQRDHFNDFSAGFNACLTHLAEQVEFDFFKAASAVDEEGDPDWGPMAELFDQMKVRVALAENIVREREQREHLLREEIKALEEKLAHFNSYWTEGK